MASHPLTVRIDSEIDAKLRATTKQIGMNVSDFVRQAIYEKLAEVENDSIRQEVENLREEIEKMRGEFAKSVRAMLIVSGSNETYPKAKAEEWVHENLGYRHPKQEGTG